MILNELYQKLVSVPLKLLVSPRVLPDDPIKELSIDANQPVYYVLQRRSTSSFVMLKNKAKELNLPAPQLIGTNAKSIPNGGVFFLQNKNLFGFGGKVVSKYQKLLTQLIERQAADKNIRHQLMPVSIYWGRNPGKEQSVFRLFFTDTENATVFRKFFLFLFQGRNSFVRFAEPVNLNAMIKKVASDTITTKLTRILRVHFHRHRQAAMGPLISNRRQVITNVVVSPNVKRAIEREMSQKKLTKAKARKLAEKYADEIASAYSYKTVRILESALTHLWNKIYDGVEVQNAEMVRKLAETHEIVYVPCHRSHIDYLLLSYTLYHEGLVPPHIAAGINLNFWPAGPILRRGGAFFLRRSFGGNKLYTAVFNEYIYQLMDRGIPLEFFPEGGRSRTGRLLPPKTGLLAMIVQSCLRGTRKPTALVPVYIGYERMFEGKSYLAELQGAEKQKESFGQLLGLRKTLKQTFGKVYLNFAKPLMLNDYLDEHQPSWRELKGEKISKPNWLTPQVTELADELMQRINNTVTLNSVSLIGLVLLSTERLALGEIELKNMLSLLVALAKKANYSDRIYCPQTSPDALIEQAEKLGTIYQLDNPLGKIISTDEKTAILLTYYRNNILHVFITPAIIASSFLNQESVEKSQLVQELQSLYPLLQKELFLAFDKDTFEAHISRNIEVMIEQGLLKKDGDMLFRVNEGMSISDELSTLAQFARPTLLRYGIILSLLSSQSGHGEVSREGIESRSQQLAQRIAALYSLNAPESFDKKLFRNTMTVLREQKLVKATEDNKIAIQPELSQLQDIILNKVNLSSRLIMQKATEWAEKYWQSPNKSE